VFLLDTDHLGIMQARTHPEVDRLRARMGEHSPEEFYVSIVSFHEQVLGWNAYIQRAKALAGVVRGYRRFQGILADFAAMQVLSFDLAAAEVFESLRERRVRVSTMDLRIAATALSRGFGVLTRNKVDFARVPGLQIEDWTVA
jgi:tRNA(fMet)-specific endonuclease VapC